MCQIFPTSEEEEIDELEDDGDDGSPDVATFPPAKTLKPSRPEPVANKSKRRRTQVRIRYLSYAATS